jgi:hypothetical protein
MAEKRSPHPARTEAAERLVARAIEEEKSVGQLVGKILERAAG